MNVNFRNWSSEIADSIQSKLSSKTLKGADAWSEIKSACCKTVEDLKIILNGLDKFQANELQIDQTKGRNTFFSNLYSSLGIQKAHFISREQMIILINCKILLSSHLNITIYRLCLWISVSYYIKYLLLIQYDMEL